jgi:predicted Zn-dependent protease
MEETDFVPEADEQRIWMRSVEEQGRLDDSGLIYRNAQLTDYLNTLAQKVAPEGLNETVQIRVEVIKNPLLNAFAYPNGVIYVHTGFLTKMENEAQLVTLLTHELTHITHRHATQEFRRTKKTTGALATLGVLGTPFGVFGGLASILGAVGAKAAVSGYSRERETEADLCGLDLLVNAGYDPREAPKLFHILKQDLEEHDVEEPFFFGSHPRLEERIDNYTWAIEKKYSQTKGEIGAERFCAEVAPVLLVNAWFDLDMGRFGSALRSTERYLERNPKTAEAHFLMGEISRERAGSEDMVLAEESYKTAIRCDASYPEPHRGLGLVYYKSGRSQEAKIEFERYLELWPNASDRAYILQYIDQISIEQ